MLDSHNTVDRTVMQRFFLDDGDSTQTQSTPCVANANLKGKSMIDSMRLPHGKDEAWRHMNMRKLFAHHYKKPRKDYSTTAELTVLKSHVSTLIDDSCQDSCLVFIDGKFAPILSRVDGIPSEVVAAGAESLTEQQLKLDGMFPDVPDASERPRDSFGSDVISALNLARLEDVACILVPADLHVHIPVQVLFCNTAQVNDGSSGKGAAAAATVNGTWASYPRLLVELGDGASLQLKQSFATIPIKGGSSSSDPAEVVSSAAIVSANLVGSCTDIQLGENSRLVHTYVQDLAASSRHLEVLSSRVRSNASYEVAAVQVGSTIGRINLHVDLLSPSANCSVYGITLAGQRQSLDMHSSILHGAPSATSRQQQRNVVADRGEAIFKGRIRVPQEAQLTDSDQLCRSVMLGRRARVIAMPTLEITADNVECSHGAAVADLDQNSMFYLASRGIDTQRAKRLLLRGFVFDLLSDSILDKKSTQSLVDKLDSMYVSSSDSPELDDTGDSGSKSAQKMVSM